MPLAKLNCDQLAPFGFRVRVEAPETLDEEAIDEMRALFQRDGLLLVQGLELSHQEQITFCRNFGPVHEHPCENFLVSNVDKNGHLGKRELIWHNDVPYLPSPYLAASLHALQVDPEAVGTRFASGFGAYERLPQGLRDRVADLKALQIRERVWDRPNKLTDLKPGDMCTVHSVVRTQTGTGRPYLFVNQDMTASVIGLDEAASRELLDELFSYYYEESNVHEHHWSNGDLIIWDNLALQHSRGLAGQGIRRLQRVSMTELGYIQQYPCDPFIYDSLGNEAMLAS